jgi:hypothetical protein
MFDKEKLGTSSYTFRYCNSKKTTENGLSRRRHVFVFLNKFKRKYTFWADQFDESIPFFGIKFFPSALIQSDKKFKKIVNDDDTVRVLYTCFQIMLHLRNQYPHSSFAYVAEPQRHHIYERALARLFSDIDYTFYHYSSENDNLYLMLDRKLHESNPLFFPQLDRIIDHYGFVL